MWALVDCDSFFCSCERVFRPDLRNRPVVVLSNNDGCVVARTAEAKALGVAMGMPHYQMLQQFGGLGITAFSSNYELYADMSARVMAVLRQEAPSVIQYSIDEAFLDLQGMDSIDLKQWGEALAAKVRRWTGVPVSVGIAPTRTLAKAASRFAKKYPGYRKCCFIATPQQRHTALSLLEATDVWGIGRRMGHRMSRLGIKTALDFAERSRSWVRSKFHVTGERTWLELRGINAVEIEGMVVRRQTILTSRSFPDMIDDVEGLKTHVANYAARCAAKLRRQNSVASMVTVFVDSNHFREDLEQYGASASMKMSTPTNATVEIAEAAAKILGGIFRRGIKYKRAGVMVSDLSDASSVQPDLFSFDADSYKRHRAVSLAIDEINRQLGADTVVLASQLYDGTAPDGSRKRFAHAIRRALKSPDYTTSLSAFKVV